MYIQQSGVEQADPQLYPSLDSKEVSGGSVLSELCHLILQGLVGSGDFQGDLKL